MSMVRPISLRLRHGVILGNAHAVLAGTGRDVELKVSRNRAILLKAHAIVAQAREQDRLRRCAKLAALRAIHAVRKAYEIQEKINSAPSDIERWRQRQALVETELTRIVKLVRHE